MNIKKQEVSCKINSKNRILEETIITQKDTELLTQDSNSSNSTNLKAEIWNKMKFDEGGRLINGYAILSDFELLRQAYFHIKSKPGNMTPGEDGETLDGLNNSYLEGLSKALINETYSPRPSRRVYIPKKNGKFRPLGISPPRDKIVQQALLFVLECVLEPKFSSHSHGFRPNRSCHTALKQVRSWNGVSWFIEGDIKDYFPSIDHHILANQLRRHFQEERIMNLYWKFVRAGYVEWNTKNRLFVNPEKGVPQGSIISPILSNLYLHELDEFMNLRIAKKIEENKSIVKVHIKNPKYSAITLKINRRYSKITQLTHNKFKHEGKIKMLRDDIQNLLNQRSKIKATVYNPNWKGRLSYVRFADDWLIGIWGSYQTANKLKSEISNFLSEELNLDLSLEKTLITNARSGSAKFLGTFIKRNSSIKSSGLVNSRKEHRSSRRTSTAGNILLRAPISNIVKRLADKEFLYMTEKKWISRSIINLVPLHIKDIIIRYKSVFNGYKNYYSFADNIHQLKKIHWILKESLIKTLCRKLDAGRREIVKRYGKNVSIKFSYKKIIRTISFLCPELKRSPMRFLISSGFTDPTATSKWKIRTLNLLDANCANCNSNEKVEVHHLRHIKTINVNLSPFDKKLAAINRKQVPLCHKCHSLVHAGLYKGMSLKFLAKNS